MISTIAPWPSDLFMSSKVKLKNPDNPPDLVISADTIVLLLSDSPAYPAQILEKPGSKHKNLEMLQDQNGKTVKCITGVNVVFPSIQNPGYTIK